MSYIYVLSNDYFKKNIYKIGMTNRTPTLRANELSTSTSCPGKFNIVYGVEINSDKVSIIERRIHLLLDEIRIESTKEFFIGPKSHIIKAINFVVTYSEMKSEYVNKHKSLIEGIYSNNLTLRDQQLLLLMKTRSTMNTRLDILPMSKIEFIQGFLSVDCIKNMFETKKENIVRLVKKFISKYTNLSVLVEGVSIEVFEEIRYQNNELLWTFKDEYRALFYAESGT